LIDGATNGFDVPAIAGGEIAAALTLHSNAAIERAGLIGISGGHVHLAAFAVRNSVGRRRGFLFEDFGLFAGRENFFFLELGNISRVFGRLRRFRLRLFDVETLGGIDDLGIGGIDRGRHRDARTGGKGNFYARVAAADSTPGIAGTLKPDAGEKNDGERYVEENRVGEVAFEAEIFRGVNGFGHGLGSAIAVGDGLGDDADVGDAGLAKGIDDGAEGTEGNGFVGAEKDDVAVGIFGLFFDFGSEVVNVDRIVTEIDALIFVDGDDEFLLGDFLDGVRFGDINLDTGLQDGRGDHEDDEEDEDHVDERDHVDFGKGGLRGFE
jgi:hypothetical protein